MREGRHKEISEESFGMLKVIEDYTYLKAKERDKNESDNQLNKSKKIIGKKIKYPTYDSFVKTDYKNLKRILGLTPDKYLKSTFSKYEVPFIFTLFDELQQPHLKCKLASLKSKDGIEGKEDKRTLSSRYKDASDCYERLYVHVEKMKTYKNIPNVKTEDMVKFYEQVTDIVSELKLHKMNYNISKKLVEIMNTAMQGKIGIEGFEELGRVIMENLDDIHTDLKNEIAKLPKD